MISKHNRLFDIFSEGRDRSEFTRLPRGKANVSQGYVICITPRSGSTFLTHLLRNNHCFGYPNEWFNYSSIGKIVDENGISNIDEYLEHTWSSHSSKTGVFGVELSYPQFEYLDEMMPLENVLGESIRWFYLVRENIVAQAISAYFANATGYFHSYEDRPENASPAYDADRIRKQIDLLITQEKSFEKLFRERKLSPVRLSYESMMMDKSATVALFGNVLGVSPDEEIVVTEAIKKIGGDLNVEFEERFRREEGAFLEDALRRRMPVTSMVRTV